MRKLKTFVGGSVVALLLTARAAHATPTVVFLPFQGREAAAIEQAALESLSGHHSFVAQASGSGAAQLARAGLGSKDPRFIVRAAAVLGAGMVLRGFVDAKQAVIVLYAGGSGRELARVRYKIGRHTATSVERTLYDKLRTGLGAGERLAVASTTVVAAITPSGAVAAPSTPRVPRAPVIPSPPTSRAPESRPALTSDVAPTVAAPAPVIDGDEAAAVIFEAAFGGGTLTRQLSYHQDLFGSLGGYTLRAGAQLSGSVAFYPLALWTNNFLQNLGLVAEFGHTVGVTSVLDSGAAYPTLGDRWLAGLRVRWPLAWLELGLGAAYGHQEFLLGVPPGSVPPPVPNDSYGFVDGRIDARVALGSVVSLLANGGYLLVIENGVVHSGYFPHASTAGVEAGLAVAATLFDPVELRLGASYQDYFSSINPATSDPHIAGGATDQYLAGTLSVVARIR